ncbi:MAG: 50S ribosomal protein L18 [Candidatus Marinimicrobia bacterium]|nr:50S ribosomal protein L18 [Candidatus Neomarinimicrobiota bacterium]
MSKRLRKKRELHKKRKLRVRNKIFGTPKRPRLTVRRSNKHIYTQIINDLTNESLVQVSDLSPEVKTEIDDHTKVEISKIVGKKIAEKAQKKGVEKVVFDRAGYQYHGRVKAVAEAAREAGLEF